jgi:hypothetical protein
MKWLSLVLLSLGLLAGCAQQGDPPGAAESYPDVFRQYDIALEFYKNDLGRYPSEVFGLGALYRNAESSEAWRGPYINNAAADAEGVVYKLRDGGRDYELIIVLNGAAVSSSAWPRPRIKM